MNFKIRRMSCNKQNAERRTYFRKIKCLGIKGFVKMCPFWIFFFLIWIESVKNSFQLGGIRPRDNLSFVIIWPNHKQIKIKEWLCGMQTPIKMWKNFRWLNNSGLVVFILLGFKLGVKLWVTLPYGLHYYSSKRLPVQICV